MSAWKIPASVIASMLASNFKLYVGTVEVVADQTLAAGTRINAKTLTGFRFIAAPKAYYKNSGYNQNAAFNSLNSDNTYCELTISTSPSIVYNNIIGSTEAMPAPVDGTYTVTADMVSANTAAHSKLYKSGVLAGVGTVFLPTDTFTLTADTGYKITGAGFQNPDTGAYLGFDVAGDGSTATFINDTGTEIKDYAYGVSVATVAAPVSQHTISQDDLDNFSAAHADLFVNGSPAVVGTDLFPGDVLRTTVRDGWVFYQSPDAPDGFIQVYTRYLYDGSFAYFEREGVTFKAGTFTVGDNGAFGTISADTVLEQPEGVKGFNNVYEVNDDQLKLITQSRWLGPPEPNSDPEDYGKYILGLINLPFKISPTMVVGEQAVRMGPLNTNVAANYLNSDTIRLPLGEIAVVGTKKNFLDYKNTVAMLHLPYCDSVALDLEMVIDQTVSVEYLISLYDGTAVVNVKSSKTGDIVFTQNIDMNITIPFANIDTYPSKNAAESVKLGGDNGIRTAFIELLRNDSVLESGFFTAPIVDEKPLAGYTGFARVEEINLSSKATSYEKELIVNKLNAGVIIK